MNYDALAYENPWRKNFEARAAFVWLSAAVCAYIFKLVSGLPAGPFYWMGAICLAMMSLRLPAALGLYRLQKHLKGRPLEYISTPELIKKMSKHKDAAWLGHGFVWEARHAQRVFEILKRDWSDIVKYTTEKAVSPQVGQTWIHGVEPKEDDLYQSLSHSNLMNLIVGTTGAGKTRLFDLLITQAVMRGEAVFIIDPKGDLALRDNARTACIASGAPDRFLQFHPAYPEESVRLDPLYNFTRVTEIATRIASLIPSETGSDAFKAFGWQALNNISQALVMCYENPSLVTLKRFLETGPQQMVISATLAYAERSIPDGRREAELYLSTKNPRNPDQKAKFLAEFYLERIQQVRPSPELEALHSQMAHDKTHFSKMVANLLPIMNMLTAGELGRLLSPDYADLDDTRPITNTKKIIDNAQVAFLGLDALTDSVISSAVGSIVLSDIVSVAGDRYNYGTNNRPVNIFIDECSEVISDQVIALLNKGRGAGIRCYLAMQTIADLEARLGSKPKAMQVLGNLNNIFCLRVIDPETQEFITENLPKTRLKHVMRTQGMSSSSESPLMFSANTGERLMEEEGDLFSAQLLGALPNLEYVAKISGGLILKGRLPILTN